MTNKNKLDINKRCKVRRMLPNCVFLFWIYPLSSPLQLRSQSLSDSGFGLGGLGGNPSSGEKVRGRTEVLLPQAASVACGHSCCEVVLNMQGTLGRFW